MSERFASELAVAGSRALKKRGRPKRSSHISPEMALSAPFPELVTSPVEELAAKIKTINDLPLLVSAFEFERTHERRRNVLRYLGIQMSRLGWRENEPLAGYDEMHRSEILFMIRKMDAEDAERVYCYELRNRRRMWAICELEPKAGHGDVPAKFRRLSTTPSRRMEVRETLSQMTENELHAAYLHEEKTKRRVVMLRSIRNEIRLRSVSGGDSAAQG